MFSNERSHQSQYPTGCGREDCTICYEEPQENLEEGPEFPPAPGSYQWSDGLTKEEMEELKKKLASVKEESTISPKGEPPKGNPPKGGSSVMRSSLEELAWEKATEFLENSKLERRPVLHLITYIKDNNFCLKVLDETGAIIYHNTRTGIEELSHYAEDISIPIRDMLEALGYDTFERFENV